MVLLGNNVMFTDKAASVASWIVMPKYYEDNADTVLQFTRALYKAMDYQQDNVEETCKWVAEQVAQDFDVIFAQRGDADWPTSEEVVTMAKDGTLKAFYQTQQDAFLSSGAVEESCKRTGIKALARSYSCPQPLFSQKQVNAPSITKSAPVVKGLVSPAR